MIQELRVKFRQVKEEMKLVPYLSDGE